MKHGALLSEDGDNMELETPTEPLRKKYKDALKKKREERTQVTASKYHPAVKKAIVGSASEVERVWSAAGDVMTKKRSSMSPIVFEAIMYLKYNRRLWNLTNVVEANKRRKKQSLDRADNRKERRARVAEKMTGFTDWEAVYAALPEVS